MAGGCLVAEKEQSNLWLLRESSFTSATLEVVCISEDAKRNQALHLPGEVCVTLVKKPWKELSLCLCLQHKSQIHRVVGCVL